MRLLIFSQDQQLLRFFNIDFPKKSIIDVVDSEDDFFNNFYLNNYDLILLDIIFIGTDSSDLIEEIRGENQRVPIVCLLEKNKYSNLAGILSTQINYLLFKPDTQGQLSQIISFNLLDFDQNLDLFFAQNKSLKLSKQEHLLLRYLFFNQNKFNSKIEIAKKIMKESYSTNSNLIDVYIYRLRKILESSLSGVKIINRKNFGYKIAACTKI